MALEQEMKAIRLLQIRTTEIDCAHTEIANDLVKIKAALSSVAGAAEVIASTEYALRLTGQVDEVGQVQVCEQASWEDLQAEAQLRVSGDVRLTDILTDDDFHTVDAQISKLVNGFNARYGLEGWDYVIAGSCGLMAAILDLLCVKAPLRPTVSASKEVNGLFNRAVQKAFNGLLPPELCRKLGCAYEIGGGDTSSVAGFSGARVQNFNPTNHRLRSLAHDPLLAFIFGVLDARRGTCTVVTDGSIRVLVTRSTQIAETPFQLLGRVFGHLLSDVNAPTAKGNRGMGLPAPFMGLLRMLESIPVGQSDFGKQIEGMFINGYDFRQFVATGLPVSLIEVLMRALFIGKQVHVHGSAFGQAVLDTMPGSMNPRFRTMLSLAYGTCSAVNAGKIFVTGDLLNASYASWMGLAWNGFHSLRWALIDRHAALWTHVTEEELRRLEETVGALDELSRRAARLPV